MKNKKTLLVVSTHSFVDLITNSSTELFVCDTKKTVDAIKELLAILLQNHDSITGEKHSFESVYGTIKVSPYQFQWWDVPTTVKDRYKQYHEYCGFGRNKYSPVEFSPKESREKDILQKQRWDIEKAYETREEGLYEKDEMEYKRRWKAAKKEIDVLFTPYGANALKTESELFLEFLKQNKFTSIQIKKAKSAFDKKIKTHIKENRGEYANSHLPLSKKLEDAYEDFRTYCSWGITCKKGDVFIYSAEDNTIPYEMFGTIESYLNADRFHLG